MWHFFVFLFFDAVSKRTSGHIASSAGNSVISVTSVSQSSVINTLHRNPYWDIVLGRTELPGRRLSGHVPFNVLGNKTDKFGGFEWYVLLIHYYFLQK